MTEADELASIVEAVLARQRVPRAAPWHPNDERAVDALLREAVAALAEQLAVEARADFDHYGSGYASFVDAWFRRTEASVRRDGPVGWESASGLTVLFSRLAPVVCLLESEKSWSDTGAKASSMPRWESVDAWSSPSVSELRARAEPWLTDRGFVVLRSRDVERPLPTTVTVPTLLANGPLREFDALFHWED